MNDYILHYFKSLKYYLPYKNCIHKNYYSIVNINNLPSTVHNVVMETF